MNQKYGLVFRAAMLVSLLVPSAIVPPTNIVTAQESSELDAQKKIADRFLEVLLRRPRPGTALDRVYGYHIQAGTLDQFVDDLIKQASEAEGADSGARHMLAGLVQLQRGNDAAAAEQFAAAEPLLSEDSQVSFYLGRALQAVGRTNDAATAYERAIDRKPLRNEALPIFSQLGRIYQRAQQNEKALSAWTRLEEMFPGDLRVGEEIARTLADEGQLDSALERFEKLAEAAKKTSQSDYRSIGYAIAAAQIKRQLGRNDEATKDLESLLARLRPGSWMHSDVRARIEAGFLRSGDFGALADYYTAALEKQPDDLDTRMRLGRALAKAGRLVDAQKALEEAIEKAPGSTEARLALIQILKTSGKPVDAAMQFEQLAKLDPENPDYLAQWGSLLMDDDTKSLDERRAAASQVWNQLAESRDEDAVVIAKTADLLRGIEQNDEAIKLYQKCIELEPDQPQYREYLGEFLHRLDRKDEALEIWSGLADGDRRTRENLIRLAEVYTTFEYSDRALKSFSEAAEMDPTLLERLRYAELLARAEKYDDSLSQINSAAELAQTPEEREQVLRSRISVFARSGQLADRIADAKKKTEAADVTAGDYRKLALLLEADTRLPDAIAAIRSAIELSPRDPELLSISASLYEKSSMLSDAVGAFEQLAKLDTRYQSSYLKRIAQLQMRLGKIDDALETSRQLITLSPGSPDPYRTHSDFCFQAGREEEGLQTLRRAIRVAPRDSDCRLALARALADRFRTDEAIELYWQEFRSLNEFDDKRGTVRSLAPLYDRKSDLNRLLSRLEDDGRENSDARTATLLTAAALEAAGDLGGARERLEPLLADNPSDVDLLEQLVSLCDSSGELERAAGYQKQILALAETPENRMRYIRLLVDTGKMDGVDAAMQRLGSNMDPYSAVRMIDGAFNKRDIDAAIKICREVIQRRPDLWEIKLRLAYALMLNEEYDEATTIANDLRLMDLPDEKEAESTKQLLAKRKASRSSSRTSPIAQPTYPKYYWAQYSYQIAQSMRIGSYANYSFSGSNAIRVPSTNIFGMARTTAQGILLAIAAKQDKLDEKLNEYIPKDFFDSERTLDELWTAYHATMYENYFRDRSNQTAPIDPLTTNQYLISVQLAKKAVDQSEMPLLNSLSNREQSNKQRGIETQPLSDEQLDVLETVAENVKIDDNNWRLQTTIFRELKLGKRDEAAKKIAAKLPEAKDLKSIRQRMQFAASTENNEAIRESLEQLDDLVEKSGDKLDVKELVQVGQALSLASANLKDDDLAARVLNNYIETESLRRRSQPQRRSRSSSSQMGQINSYRIVNGNYYSVQINAPLSDRLASQSFIQQVHQSLLDPEANEIQLDLLKKLEQTVSDDMPEDEQKLRKIAVAFAYWWAKDPETAYEHVKAIAQQYPDDVNLQIESARLAAELKRPRESLRALDAFEPLDQRTLQIRELAAMNLATQLGEFDRAKEAAKRLFGLKLDSNTQLALADQMQRLGLPDMAKAVLSRMRRRGGNDSSTMIRMANFYSRNGDKDAAAEAAYQIVRRANSTRASSRDTSYKRQAVQLLGKLGRLDKIIEQAEKRVESAPNSAIMKGDLVELYNAAGRKDDAKRIVMELAKLSPDDPKTILQTAEQLAAAKKHSEAMDKYLEAFKEQPNLMSQHFYQFTDQVRKSKRFDDVYRELSTWNVKDIPSFRHDELLNLQRNSNAEMSEAELKFADHMLAGVPPRSLGELIDDLEHRKGFDKLKSIGSAIERIFDDRNAYLKSGQIWRNGGWGSDGTFYGPYDSLMTYIGKNENVRKTVLESIEKYKEDETLAPAAQLFAGAIEFKQTKKAKTLAAELRKHVDPDNRTVDPHLIWQIAQTLENRKGLNDLVVKLYEYVNTDPQVSRHRQGFEYGIGPKLVTANFRAGNTAKARAMLWKGFESTDNSQDNQHNPGYGDYQDLNAYRSIAQMFMNNDLPLDAIRVYNAALADSEKFERARQWRGSSSTRESFEKLLATTIKSLKPEKYSEYLSSLVVLTVADEDVDSNDDESDDDPDNEKNVDTPFAVDFYALKPNETVEPDRLCVAAMMFRAISEGEGGAETIGEFDKRLSGLVEERPDDFSVLGMQALLSTVSGRPDAADRLNKTLEKLPSIDVKEKPDLGQPKTKVALDMLSLALIAIASDDNEVANAGEKLADYLLELANISGAGDHGRTLISLRLKNSDSPEARESSRKTFVQMLDFVAPPTDDPRVLSSEKAKECLRIAKLAADAELLGVSVAAARRALAAGPPLRQIQSGGDAFTLPTRSSSSSRRDSEAAKSDMQELAVQLADLTDVWANLDNGKQGTADVLANIVMPPTRPGEMFLYPVSLFGRNVRISKVEDFQPRGAAIALADAVKRAENAPSILARIDKIKPSLSDPIQAEVAALLLAVKSDEPDTVKTRYDALIKSAEKILPPIESVSAEFVQASPRSISSQMMQDSLATFDMADSLSQALLPMAKNKSYQADADRGLLRMIGMIVSDGYAHSRVEGQVGFMTKDLVNRFAKRGEDELLNQTIGTRLASMGVRYSGYSGDYGEQIIKSESRMLSMQVARLGKWSMAAELARKLPATSLRESAETRHAANLCLVLSDQKDPDQRYENAALISLGVGDDSTFRHFDNDLRYQVPPAELAEAAPRAKELEKLPRWADDVSMTSTALVLLHAAVESGRTDELLAELTKRVKSPGDDVDALIGTLHLLTDNRVSAKEKLALVSKRVLDIDEKKVDKKWNVSTVALGFAAKCIDAELDSELAVNTLDKLLTHSRKASINNLTSIIGRKLAVSGGGVAAGASENHSLQHFHVIATAGSYGQADPKSSMPMTAVSDGKIHQVGGFGFHSLMLKYPLKGNFTFSSQPTSLGYGESTMTANGVTFAVEAWQKKLVTREIASWNGPKFDCDKVEHGKASNLAIELGEDKIEFSTEGESQISTHRTSGFPFVGMQTTQFRITEFADLKIKGDVVIPREVNLVDPQLRGWMSLLYGGTTPDPLLPIAADKDPEEVAKQREDAKKKESERCTWYTEDGQLKSGARFSHRGSQSGLADLQYLRPLLDGESVTMEFFKDEKYSVHPSIGRVVVFLRDEGPKLSWLPLAQSIECDDIKYDGEYDPADRQLSGEKIPLKENDWNELKLTADSGKVIVSLNGQALCSVPTHWNDRFGIIRESDQSVKIRNLKLSGPWPEKLPDGLMATK